MRRRKLTLKTPSDLPSSLEAQAAALRRRADAMEASGSPIDLIVNGTTQTLNRLTASDLREDAWALEADAKKLRTLYT